MLKGTCVDDSKGLGATSGREEGFHRALAVTRHRSSRHDTLSQGHMPESFASELPARLCIERGSSRTSPNIESLDAQTAGKSYVIIDAAAFFSARTTTNPRSSV